MPVTRWRWPRHAVLDVIAEEQLCQRAEQLGSHLQEVLNRARYLPGDR